MQQDIEKTKSFGILSAFLDHPHEVGEGYFEHMLFATRFASLLGLAAGAALVHAVFPFLCKTTASRIIFKLHDRIANR
jgi:hypothetical protein